MRGKKIDTSFIGTFITECVTNGKVSQEEIVAEAKAKIDTINVKIIEAENLKILRSKLMDVVITFEKAKKSSNISEMNSLPFFKIQNQHICKYICDTLREKSVDINFYKESKYNVDDILFTIKQLIEHNVVSKMGNKLLRGSEFDQYLKFVLSED